MDEHLSLSQLEQYQARTLLPGELISVARHLAVCDRCHQRFYEIAPLPENLSPLTFEDETGAVEDEFHLDYDEHLAPYVDGTADDIDRELVESHVELCESCAEELRELFTLQAEIAQAQATASNPSPANAGATLHPPPLAPTSEGNAGRVEEFAWLPAQAQWSARSWRIGAIAVACVGVAATILLLLLLLWRNGHEEREAITARTANVAPASSVHTGETNGANINASPGAAIRSSTPGGDMAQAHDNANLSRGEEAGTNGRETESDKSNPARRDDAARVSLDDGGRVVTLDGAGRLAGLEDVPAAYRQAIARALREQWLEVSPEVAALADHRGRLRSAKDDEESFALASPVGTVTRTVRPAFRWQPLADAKSYTVRIYDANLNLIADSPSLNTTEWTPPAPLAPGKVYSWQVTATKEAKDGSQQVVIAPAPQAPEARFRVLSSAQAAELERAERIASNSHLLRAVIYAEAGLLNDAESELKKLAAANPRSTTAKRLLHSLKTRHEVQRKNEP